MEPAVTDIAGGGSSTTGAGGGSSSSRWNPTKEQLSMLEGLYEQGIRTPSAEQIQSITEKLQVYGHIEGKNVFYWFQNHKARQRQKQKMDQMMPNGAASNNNIISTNLVAVNNLNYNNNHCNNASAAAAYFNRFYYPASPPVSPSIATAPGRSQPLFLPSPHNVAYSPYYMAQPEYGFYQHCPKMVLPNHVLNNDSQTPAQIRLDFHRDVVAPVGAQNEGNAGVVDRQVTLDLFPVHPTGILDDREQHLRSTSVGSSIRDYSEAGSEHYLRQSESLDHSN